jgi:hypothetical protein
LVSGLIEESLNETQEALNRADSALKKSGDKKPIEEAFSKKRSSRCLMPIRIGISRAMATPEKEDAEGRKRNPEEKKPDEPKKDDQPSGK